MKHRLLLLFSILASQIFAQSPNLVLNPSFEEVKANQSKPACTYASGPYAFSNPLKNWSTFPDCTPDLVVWNDSCHFPKPHTGNNEVGIITYLPALDMGKSIDFHEFIQGRLAKPLTKGKEYTFAFYVQLGKAAGEHHIKTLNQGMKTIQVIPVAAGSLGVWFTDYEEKTMALDVAFPQLVWYDPIVTKHGEWLLLSKNFKADRAYTHFTIGNFTTDNNTATNLPNSAEVDEFNTVNKSWQTKKRRVGYYLLDDFYLGEGPPPAPALSIVEDLKKNNAYIFKNVNFESGKWDLLPEAMPELNSLLEYLKSNPSLSVEIGGHTDNVGNDEANRSLSEKRAEAVANYLISKGISAKNVSAKGYGESKPTASNDNENGRLANRRVECKVI
ncbi:MAG: OmpA family protein [Saprospiraceae bacterium]|nr:OmpA family protein [Saprospiraceae bacterium]